MSNEKLYQLNLFFFISENFCVFKTDSPSLKFWKRLKIKYFLYDTVSKSVTITLIEEFIYTIFKNIEAYRPKYHYLKANKEKKGIDGKNILKNWIWNNFELLFKTDMKFINEWISKEKNWEKDQVSFKVIQEKKTNIKAKIKSCVNFVLINPNVKLKKKRPKKQCSLLIDLNVRNVVVNIWLTRQISSLKKGVTSIIGEDIFFTSMKAKLLEINRKLQKDLPNIANI